MIQAIIDFILGIFNPKKEDPKGKELDQKVEKVEAEVEEIEEKLEDLEVETLSDDEVEDYWNGE